MFKEWLKKRTMAEGLADGVDAVANFKFNPSDEVADDQDAVQKELFKIVLRKYPEETMEFLNSLAMRGDPEVSALVRKMGQNKSPMMAKEPRHPYDKHEVVPSSADIGHSPEGE